MKTPIEFDAVKLSDSSTKDGGRKFVFVADQIDDRPAIDRMCNELCGSQWRIVAIPLDDDGNPVGS